MGPEAIVHRHERGTPPLHLQRGQHHMTRVQRMDVIGRKSVLLLHRMRHAKITRINDSFGAHISLHKRTVLTVRALLLEFAFRSSSSVSRTVAWPTDPGAFPTERIHFCSSLSTGRSRRTNPANQHNRCTTSTSTRSEESMN